MSRLDSTTPPQFFINVSLTNPSFRLPDLYSAAKLYGFDLRIHHPWSAEAESQSGPTSGLHAQVDNVEARQQQAIDFTHQGRSAFIVVEILDLDGNPIMDLDQCVECCKRLAERCILVK